MHFRDFQVESSCSYLGFTTEIGLHSALTFFGCLFICSVSYQSVFLNIFGIFLSGRDNMIRILYPYRNSNTDKLLKRRNNICNNVDVLENVQPNFKIIDRHIATVDKNIA